MASTIQVDKIQDQGGNTMISSNGSGTFTSNLPTTSSGYAFISKSTIGANTADTRNYRFRYNL